MTTLIEAIRQKANGIYRFRGDASKVIATLASAEQPRHIRLKNLTGKKTFIDAVGQALAFPDYSAKNWDAFEESLNELEPAPPSGLLIELDGLREFATKYPDDLETAFAIFADATEAWQLEGIGFWILVEGAGDVTMDFPVLTAN